MILTGMICSHVIAETLLGHGWCDGANEAGIECLH